MSNLLARIAPLLSIAAAMIVAIQPAELCCRLSSIAMAEAKPACCEHCPSEASESPLSDACQCCVSDSAVVASVVSVPVFPVVVESGAFSELLTGRPLGNVFTAFSNRADRTALRDHVLMCVWRC